MTRTVDVCVEWSGLWVVGQKYGRWGDDWYFPGGVVDEGESLDSAARRELMEECGLSVQGLSHVGDLVLPGWRPNVTTSVFVAALSEPRRPRMSVGDDLRRAEWVPAKELARTVARMHRPIVALLERRGFMR